MYYFINIILLILLFYIIFSGIRRKKVEKEIRCMICSEKCRLISSISTCPSMPFPSIFAIRVPHGSSNCGRVSTVSAPVPKSGCIALMVFSRNPNYPLPCFMPWMTDSISRCPSLCAATERSSPESARAHGGSRLFCPVCTAGHPVWLWMCPSVSPMPPCRRPSVRV